jgi:hypothetical protein
MPAILISWPAVFRPCCTAPVWTHVLVLVGGAVLAPGKRTVTQALRVMGLADRPGFGRYHEVLNHARWDARDVARRWLRHLLAVPFAGRRWALPLLTVLAPPSPCTLIPPHGTMKANRPSATPSPPSAASCGRQRAFPCPGQAPKPSKSRSPC